MKKIKYLSIGLVIIICCLLGFFYIKYTHHIVDNVLRFCNSKLSHNDSCVFNFGDITDFQWDDMCYISAGSNGRESEEFVQRILGYKPENLTDKDYGSDKLYFFYNGRMVREFIFSYNWLDETASPDTSIGTESQKDICRNKKDAQGQITTIKEPWQYKYSIHLQ